MKILQEIYYYTDENGKKIIDTEEIRREFDFKLNQIVKDEE